MPLDPLLEHYRVPQSECASTDGSTLWQRRPEPLGRGAYGEVWVEENVAENKLRAVKTVRYPTAEQGLFSAEVNALVNLSQRRYRPFFGEFMGFYQDESSVSFFMEYFPQRDLRKHLPQGAEIPEDQAKAIIRQVLYGVCAMHEQNFTHRDLKPENIFVVSTDPWRVKIGDFGVSKKISDGRAQLETRVGTEHYMAPEIFYFVNDDMLSPGGYSNSVDIWSTGVLLFELLTGERPFPTHAKLKAYCDGRYPFPDTSLALYGISADGCDLVRSMLRPRPADRPSAVEALKSTWFHASGVSPHQSPLLSFQSSSPRIGSTLRQSSTVGVLPTLSTGPPVKPLPVLPPKRVASISSQSRYRDEGYHTSSDRDVLELIDSFPSMLTEQPDRNADVAEWQSNIRSSPRLTNTSSPRMSSKPPSRGSSRGTPPMRPPRPDEPFGMPSVPTSTPDMSTSRFKLVPDVHTGLGIRPAPLRTNSAANSPALRQTHDEEADRVTPLSTTLTEPKTLMSRTSTARSESVRSSARSVHSVTSSIADVREAVTRKIWDGQWKVGDVVILLQVSKWDLIRISAHTIKSSSPVSLSENYSKNYINELPKKILDALKPYLADNLGVRGSAKNIAKDESTYHSRIKEDILPVVDLEGDDAEYYTLKLPKTLDVMEISANMDGDGLRVPAPMIRKVVSDHWKMYIAEYIHGFLFNERAVGKAGARAVRAVVFDEPAVEYSGHEGFYRGQLEKKLPGHLEFANHDGFRKFVERTEKGKEEGKKSKFPWGKAKAR